MHLTKHAESRMTQRGISRDLVEIVGNYGRARFSNGAVIIDMDEEGINSYLGEDPAPLRQVIDKLKKVYLVTVDSTVVTVSRTNKRYKKKFN